MDQKELLEKKNDLITRAEETINKAKNEKRELTEAEMAELAEIKDNVKKIKNMLEMSDFFSGENQKMSIQNSKKEGESVMESSLDKEKMESRAFENYIRGITTSLRANAGDDVNMDMGTNYNTKIIPTTIADKIIRKVYDISPVLERSTKYNVKGKLEIPTYPKDTSTDITVTYQSEFTDIVSSSGSFNTVSLDGFLAGALTKISRSLINNAQFDLVNFVVDQMAYNIKRFIEHELLVGTSGKVAGLSGSTNVVTAASTSVITADEIVQLHDKIKDEFQNNAIWVMSPATRTALRLLKYDPGYYLLNNDVSSPYGTTLLGKPVFVSDNMPAISSGNAVIYYGDMSGLATKFTEEINIEVLRERYAPQHAIGVVGWFEFDAAIQDQGRIATLKMHS